MPQNDIASFERDLHLRRFAPVTLLNTSLAVGRYLDWCQERGIDPHAGKREDLLDYLSHLQDKGLMQSTIKNNFSYLSTYYEFLLDNGQIQVNPVAAIRKRYLKTYKDQTRQRQLISVEDAAKMVRMTIDTRDKAILVLLFKTGIRRNELATLDVGDVDLKKQEIILKPTGKRSNRIVFFDDETELVLRRWLTARETRFKKKGHEKALFVSIKGVRLHVARIETIVKNSASLCGMHDPKSDRLEDRFSPHCCRHFVTTHLLRAGMNREYVKWLRGDSTQDAIDVYFHIDPYDVRKEYLSHVPRLGI